MTKIFACRDIGADCPYVARGETEDELMADIAKHGKEVHGYTDEQLNDPELLEKIKASVKEEIQKGINSLRHQLK